MTLVPMGAFLVGAVLSLVLPAGTLAALGLWYWRFTMRVPETPTGSAISADPADATPAPNVPQALPADPAV